MTLINLRGLELELGGYGPLDYAEGTVTYVDAKGAVVTAVGDALRFPGPVKFTITAGQPDVAIDLPATDATAAALWVVRKSDYETTRQEFRRLTAIPATGPVNIAALAEVDRKTLAPMPGGVAAWQIFLDGVLAQVNAVVAKNQPNGVAGLDGGGKIGEAQVPTRLGVQELNNTIVSVGGGLFSPIPGVGEIGAMGDSITNQGNTKPTSTVGPILGGRSYLAWATILSHGRLRYGVVAATSGFTPAQIKVTHLPTVLAARPRYCVVLAGTNPGISIAQDRADILDIWTTLIAAGITPIAATLPAQASSGFTRSVATIQAFNSWIRITAQRMNIPVADFYAATVDSATGSAQAGLLYDSLHPKAAGAKLMGRTIAAAVGAERPLPPLAQANVWANVANAVPSNALNQAWGAGRAQGWSFTGAGATVAQVAMTADEGSGFWQELTPGTGAAQLLTQNPITLVAGRKIAIGMRIKTSGMTAAGSFFGARLIGAGGALAWWYDFEQTDIDLGTLYLEVPVLADTTAASIRVDATIGKVSVGQITCVDLTAAGVA